MACRFRSGTLWSSSRWTICWTAALRLLMTSCALVQTWKNKTDQLFALLCYVMFCFYLYLPKFGFGTLVMGKTTHVICQSMPVMIVEQSLGTSSLQISPCFELSRRSTFERFLALPPPLDGPPGGPERPAKKVTWNKIIISKFGAWVNCFLDLNWNLYGEWTHKRQNKYSFMKSDLLNNIKWCHTWMMLPSRTVQARPQQKASQALGSSTAAASSAAGATASSASSSAKPPWRRSEEQNMQGALEQAAEEQQRDVVM